MARRSEVTAGSEELTGKSVWRSAGSPRERRGRSGNRREGFPRGEKSHRMMARARGRREEARKEGRRRTLGVRGGGGVYAERWERKLLSARRVRRRWAEGGKGFVGVLMVLMV